VFGVEVRNVNSLLDRLSYKVIYADRDSLCKEYFVNNAKHKMLIDAE